MRVEKVWAGWGFYGPGDPDQSKYGGPGNVSSPTLTRAGMQAPANGQSYEEEPTSGFSEEQGPVRVRCETSVRRQKSGTSVTEVTR